MAIQDNKNRDWSISKYSKHVRISEECWEWVKKNKGKFSVAGKLDSIIKNYIKNNGRPDKDLH